MGSPHRKNQTAQTLNLKRRIAPPFTMHFRTEIRNVTIVNEGRTFLGSLLIDDDRIDRITEG